MTRRELTREPSAYVGEIPRRCDPSIKHTAFCAMGGGGSSTLILRVAQYARFVGMRPDNCFLPVVGFDRILTPGAWRIHSDSSPLSEQGTSEVFDINGVLAGFYRQTGYHLDVGASLDTNVLAYLQWLREHDGAAVFWQLAGHRFFSRHHVPDVVFLIRRPLDTWQSVTEPWRHVALFDAFGGREHLSALAIFCGWWLGMASEYLRLRDAGLDPVLLRYDRAPRDAESLPDELAAQFAEGSTWRPRMRDPNTVPPAVRDYIERHTGDLQARIWED